MKIKKYYFGMYYKTLVLFFLIILFYDYSLFSLTPSCNLYKMHRYNPF